MKPLEPIQTVPLFPDERAALLDLLSSLTPEQWAAPTVCAGWSVKDIADHLLADDLGMLSGRRDGYRSPDAQGRDLSDWDTLITFINHQNATWVTATRRLSPRVVIDLLRFSGAQTQALFESLDGMAMGGRVNWASDQPVPVWMELAREYTERWTHQQQIRDAVDQPGLTDRRTFGPVLDAFVRALPKAYAPVEAAPGTSVVVTISGEAGGSWLQRREDQGWIQYVHDSGDPPADSTVALDQDSAWRLFTRGISPAEAQTRAVIQGNRDLGLPALNTVSMLV